MLYMLSLYTLYHQVQCFVSVSASENCCRRLFETTGDVVQDVSAGSSGEVEVCTPCGLVVDGLYTALSQNNVFETVVKLTQSTH